MIAVGSRMVIGEQSPSPVRWRRRRYLTVRLSSYTEQLVVVWPSERLVGQEEGVVVQGVGATLQEGRQTAVVKGGARGLVKKVTTVRFGPAAGQGNKLKKKVYQ